MKGFSYSEELNAVRISGKLIDLDKGVLVQLRERDWDVGRLEVHDDSLWVITGNGSWNLTKERFTSIRQLD